MKQKYTKYTQILLLLLLFYGCFLYGLPRWARRNIHPLPPNMIINHPLSASSIYYLWHHLFSIYVPDSLSAQSWSWHPRLHTPYIFYPITVFFHSIWPYHHNLFCCTTEIISSNPGLSLNSLLGTLSFSLTPHIHWTILISACWSVTSFSFLTSQVSLLCNILLRTQLLYNLLLTINNISLLVSNRTNCLNSCHPIQILASTAAWESPSARNMPPK